MDTNRITELIHRLNYADQMGEGAVPTISVFRHELRECLECLQRISDIPDRWRTYPHDYDLAHRAFGRAMANCADELEQELPNDP